MARAVQTAFRLNELRSLRVRSLMLDSTPPQVVIRADQAKNRMKGAVAIPNDLALALPVSVKGRDDDDQLFPFPTSHRGVLDMFRRDLDGAKIK